MARKEYISIVIRQCIKCELKHLSDKVTLIFKKNDIALKESRKITNLQIDSINEVNHKIQKQLVLFLPRKEFNVRHELIEKELQTIQKLVYIGVGICFVLDIVFSVGLFYLLRR